MSLEGYSVPSATVATPDRPGQTFILSMPVSEIERLASQSKAVIHAGFGAPV
jgi:hypothetical protein